MFGFLFGRVARMGIADALRVGLTVVAVLAATLGVAGLLAAGPALAQTSGGFPDYVLEEDETVRIEGDTTTDCTSFASGLEEGYFESGDISLRAQRVLDQCEEAGLLDTGGGTPSASASASASEPAGGEDAALPETGGVLLAPLFVVAMLVASAAGLLALRKIG